MLRKLLHTADAKDNGKPIAEILKRRFAVSEMQLRRIRRTEKGLLKNGEEVYTIDTVVAGDAIEVILEPEERASSGVVRTAFALSIKRISVCS